MLCAKEVASKLTYETKDKPAKTLARPEPVNVNATEQVTLTEPHLHTLKLSTLTFLQFAKQRKQFGVKPVER